MRNRKYSLFLFAVLALTGCNMRGPQYSEEAAYDTADVGYAVMEEWVEEYYPAGKVIETHPYEFVYPSGPSYLTDYVQGVMFDGERERTFSVNITSGSVSLEADEKMREEFAEYARALYLASLDLHPDDDIGGFDALLLYDRVDSVNNNWGITRYQTYELPGELVAEGGDIKAYVNDTTRGEIILLYGFIGANDDEDLSTYTPENLEKR